MSTSTPPPWLNYLGFVPIAVYFLVKYVVIGPEQLTSRQSWLLIGFIVLAEIGLWQYRKQFKQPQEEDTDGTD